MSAFNRTPRYSNPLATADATRMTAHGITVQSGKFYGGNRDAGVMPRFVTRFTDADGTPYLHVGTPQYFDLEGQRVKKADAAVVCGAAAITDGATLELVSNGIFVSGEDATVGHIVKLR